MQMCDSNRTKFEILHRNLKSPPYFHLYLQIVFAHTTEQTCLKVKVGIEMNTVYSLCFRETGKKMVMGNE